MNEIELLFEAIKKNDFPEVRDLILRDPSLAGYSDEAGIYPVFLAAGKGHFDLLRYLVEYSHASLNIYDIHHRGLLHYAAIGGNSDLFAYTVERTGADLLEVDDKCLTPLDLAVESGHQSIIDYYRVNLGIFQDDLYRNPVLPGAYPDPSVIRVGEDYYMATSSFIFFPAIPVLHSRDLVNWKTIGHAIANSDYIDMKDLDDGRGFWAPDISFYEGKFYITATLRLNDGDIPMRRQMIVSSEKAEGPYSRPVFIDEDGIDPSLFADDDNSRYMLLNRGARILPLDRKAETAIGSAELLWYGAQKRAPEAPHLLKKDGYYYLFVSEGGTGRNHQISVARSKELMGPYESCPFNPILHQNDPDHPIQRSGHGKLVSTHDGRWFILYLCSRMIDRQYSILGRETALDKVSWTADGWPIVNGLKGPGGAGIKPLPEKPFPSQESSWFTDTTLDLYWISPRNWNPGDFRLIPEERKLEITGSPENLSSYCPGSLLLRRQTSPEFSFEIELLAEFSQNKAEAGVCCYYDHASWLKLALRNEGDKQKIILTKRDGTDEMIIASLLYTGGYSVLFKVETEYLKRSFYYRLSGNEDWKKLVIMDNIVLLCDEGGTGKRFTGPLYGIYCRDIDSSGEVKALFTGRSY